MRLDKKLHVTLMNMFINVACRMQLDFCRMKQKNVKNWVGKRMRFCCSDFVACHMRLCRLRLPRPLLIVLDQNLKGVGGSNY